VRPDHILPAIRRTPSISAGGTVSWQVSANLLVKTSFFTVSDLGNPAEIGSEEREVVDGTGSNFDQLLMIHNREIFYRRRRFAHLHDIRLL